MHPIRNLKPKNVVTGNSSDMEPQNLDLVSPCLDRYIMILRSMISEKDFICAAMGRVGLAMGSEGGNERVEALSIQIWHNKSRFERLKIELENFSWRNLGKGSRQIMVRIVLQYDTSAYCLGRCVYYRYSLRGDTETVYSDSNNIFAFCVSETRCVLVIVDPF